MSEIKNFGLKGIAKDVQFGKKGPRIKHNDDEVFQLVNTDDELINIQGADPIYPDDLVTRRFVDALNGTAIELGLPTDASWSGGAVTLTDATSVTDAIDEMNEFLALLIPGQPPNFPDSQSLTISSVGTSPLLADGAVPDNTSGGTLPSTAGQSVTRVTAATVSTNTITNTGPGNTGTLTAYVNNSAAGAITFDENDNSATNGSLVVSNNEDYPSDKPGFWQEFDARINAATATQGWNRYRIEHSEAGNTNEVYIVRDNVTAVPTVANGTVANNTTGTTANSSGVIHYNTGGIVDLANVTMTNIAGETYRSGNPFQVVAVNNGATGPVIFSTVNFTYANIGVATPVARQTTTATALSTLQIPINGSNTHTSGQVRYQGFNVNGNSGTVLVSATTILKKSGTAASTQLDENVIVGSGANAARTYLGSTANGDTPSGPLPSGAASWDSAQDLAAVGYEHEAAVVAGAMSRNLTNYTTGVLPANTVNYTSKSSVQYFTFVFTKSSLSNFSITIAGSYAGLWVGLPGVSDNSGISPNALGGAWWNGMVLYNGSGVPGRTGDTTAGCADGTAATGSSGTFVMTFGTESSTNATNNRILVRLRLNAGQSITAISLAN